MHSEVCLTEDPGVVSMIPRELDLVEADHEIISTDILPNMLIQEGQLLLTGESKHTSSGQFTYMTKPAQEKCE